MRTKTTPDEIKTFESTDNIGKSQIHIDNIKKTKRGLLLKDEETKDKLMDFIFGKSDENPMEELNTEIENREGALDKKEYNINIWGIYDKTSRENSDLEEKDV